MRGQKGWITGGTAAMPGIPAVTNAVYAGEENMTQGGVNLVQLTGGKPHVTADMITQAFDEPLTKEQVLAIVTPFIA